MKWPDPPEHENTVRSYMDELFWKQVEYVTEDTPEQARERYESAKARYRLEHKFDFLHVEEE